MQPLTFLVPLLVLLLCTPTRSALVEQGQVRVRYGTPVSQVWAQIVFSGSTSLPDLVDSESYDPYMRSDFVSIEAGSFKRREVSVGPARLSLTPKSDFLPAIRCVTFGSHELTLSAKPCKCGAQISCLSSDNVLCTFNSTKGLVDLFVDHPTLTPEVARQLRFGQHVDLGPIVLKPGDPWIRTSKTGMTNRLSLEAVVYQQVVKIDLGTRTVCVKRQEILRHSGTFESGLAFVLVLIIAGLSSHGLIQQIAVTLSILVVLLPFLIVWTPLRIGMDLARAIYLLPVLSAILGFASALAWMIHQNTFLLNVIANGVWAALWYQQYQVDTSTWDGLAGIITLTAWTWVNVRGPLWYISVVQAGILWGILTLRNPLLVSKPEFPAAMFVIIILVFWRQKNVDQ